MEIKEPPLEGGGPLEVGQPGLGDGLSCLLGSTGCIPCVNCGSGQFDGVGDKVDVSAGRRLQGVVVMYSEVVLSKFVQECNVHCCWSVDQEGVAK